MQRNVAVRLDAWPRCRGLDVDINRHHADLAAEGVPTTSPVHSTY
jgi:hypothetical protein